MVGKISVKLVMQYRVEEEKLKQVIVWIAMLNSVVAFLSDRSDYLNDYLVESEILKLVYNYLGRDDRIHETYAVEGAAFTGLYIA